ncbi:MAG TPA: GNAT family N-acetyltransferase [Ignavibacteria bacterium]|nr:GNAT family N-acetyltransferase [Ignavibacteria bacterium]
MKIELKEVTADNLGKISKLKVKESQQDFVAPNAYSVAQSKFYSTWICLAAYAGEEPVGFTMYGIDDADKTVWIIRMMIDGNHQGKGYGRQILTLAVEHIKNSHNCNEVFLSFVPGNDTAKRLYESFGFKDTGRVEEGEIVYRLQL